MGTLLSYPGLKQILEDKRIRRFGVPAEHMAAYLEAQQIAIDMRGYSESEWEDVHATFIDLEVLGLHKQPYGQYVIHAVVTDVTNTTRILSLYCFDETKFCELFEDQRTADWHWEKYKIDDAYKIRIDGYGAIVCSRLVVMLATRGVIKEHRELPDSRKITAENGAHKKGTGGYTLISKPTFAAAPGGDPCRQVRAHFRRGHIRKYHPDDKTRWSWVSSCFVNGEPEIQRKAYLVAS